MAGISSVSDSSYPYRGTLSRLDQNGDGVLSRGEVAAAQRPGILRETGEDDVAGTSPYGGLIAKLMDLREEAGRNGGLPQPATLAATDAEASAGVTQASSASDLYRNTYGQYEAD
ncbi:hypothetical protein [Rhizobium sp. BK251]|uniref:hypothetical protein n=1 Tax=Rhizobium sp. BK251 TaxID=2512125 RepID=UPI00104CFBDB|nr:hypothetical protein [Rhizobium sp. BK251]TCL70186.1 hypothetical protein EV286_10755 [Rhizobium sp. BK251]